MSQPNQGLSGIALPEGCRISVRGTTWKLDAASVHDVQQVCVMVVGLSSITRLRLRIRNGHPPQGWVGTPGIRGLAIASIRTRGTGCQVDLESGQPTDPALMVAAALRMARPWAGRVGPAISLAPGLPPQAAPLAPYLHDVALPVERVNPHLRRHDLLVVPAAPRPVDGPLKGPIDGASAGLAEVGEERGEVDEGPRPATVVVIEPRGTSHAWLVGGRSRGVLVDPTVHRPIGRRSRGNQLVGAATLGNGELRVTADGIDLRIRGDLASGDVHRLRAIAGLTVPEDLPDYWRAQLQACGVVLASDRAALPDDDLGWQVASVGERVRALKDLGPQAALGGWPSLSAVLLTHREDFIDHAVHQLTRLDYPRLQFVIGLHGITVEEERLAPLRAAGDLMIVQLEAALPFGSAMQQACQRSDGDLIAKVDDDDFYAESHLWDVVVAREYSGAQLVGKALDWIHVAPDDVTVFRPEYPAEQFATFIAGGTMLISRSDLDAVGGWRPVERSIDRGLIERLQGAGGLVYRTHGLGYLYMRRDEGHTAQARNAHFLTKTAQQWRGLLSQEALGTGDVR